jgi:hypothetical protein
MFKIVLFQWGVISGLAQKSQTEDQFTSWSVQAYRAQHRACLYDRRLGEASASVHHTPPGLPALVFLTMRLMRYVAASRASALADAGADSAHRTPN